MTASRFRSIRPSLVESDAPESHPIKSNMPYDPLLIHATSASEHATAVVKKRYTRQVPEAEAGIKAGKNSNERLDGAFIQLESQIYVSAEFDQSLDHRNVSVLNRKVHGGQPISIRHGHCRRSTMHEQQASYPCVSQSGSHVKRRASVVVPSFYVCNMSQQ
ncbi:uncharacterized protein N7515_004246 [Penicillium bovifimosum]|uniref:Uncharacterized protein n=1 Tax=Penicillium bovifimosum TaxID=126998 RepID=A0A9W9H6E2_9EURO|nr:uncharacterized protein N7515_004246 [Penicillium bovifimosum]KAJ5139398.1 hypothetical protein N7515_004246 [Penicillium bovifimosum]